MTSRSYVDRRLRQALRDFLVAKRWSLLWLLLLTTVVCTVPVLLGTPGYETGLIHGFFVATMLAMIGFVFLLRDTNTFLLAGSYAEQYTSEELVQARKAGHIWSAISNLEFADGDIDHVVLTPSGVLAVETKWHFRKADGAWLEQAAAQAGRSARKARSVLRSKHVDQTAEVRPVLVVWGGAQNSMPDLQRVGDVDIVPGKAFRAWLESCSTGRLAQDNAEQLHTRLLALKTSLHPAPR